MSRPRDNAIPTGVFSGTHCLGNGFCDGWSATSAAVKLECLTSPGLGDFGSVPGIDGAWFNSSGWISIAGLIWRRFLKYRAPDSVCISYRLGELSFGCCTTVAFCKIGFLGSNWNRTL